VVVFPKVSGDARPRPGLIGVNRSRWAADAGSRPALRTSKNLQLPWAFCRWNSAL